MQHWSSSNRELLQQLVAEHQSGLREESTISSSTIESAEEGNTTAWCQIGRELEDVGITSTMIQENRAFVIAWMKNALNTGQLGEGVEAVRTVPSTSDWLHRQLNNSTKDFHKSCFFIPWFGLSRHMMLSHIQIYLGPDVSVRSYVYQGRDGYLVMTRVSPPLSFFSL